MAPRALTRPRRADQPAAWPARAEGWVRSLAALVLLLGLATTVGWLAHLEPLVRLDASMSSMKLSTALAFTLLGLAHLVRRAAVRRVLAATALGMTLLAGAQHPFGTDLGFNQLLTDGLAGAGGEHPGRQAPTTTLSLGLLAAATLLRRERRSGSVQLMASVPLVIGLVALYGYLFGASSLYEMDFDSTMAVQTAACLVVMALGSLLAEPRGALQWIWFGRDPGAAMQRLLIPTTLVALPLAGLALVEGWRADRFGAAFAWAILVVLTVAVVIAIGLVAGQVARSIDDDRESLLAELHRANQELEDGVRMRSHQLNRQRTKLVLLEERDRIARDLHDRVIQRIFASGLQVGTLSRAQSKEAFALGLKEPALVESLNGVAAELDLAIRELRNSIFELTSIDDHENVEQVVREVASRASRILGFMPRVQVTGEIADLPAELVAQLASVMQEGLSNVARHAHATSAMVQLHATEADVELRISDDGVGLPDPLPRSSGISNLMSRARNLGGTASWAANEPLGTVMTWRAPRRVASERDGYGYEMQVAFSDIDHSPVARSAS